MAGPGWRAPLLLLPLPLPPTLPNRRQCLHTWKEPYWVVGLAPSASYLPDQLSGQGAAAGGCAEPQQQQWDGAPKGGAVLRLRLGCLPVPVWVNAWRAKREVVSLGGWPGCSCNVCLLQAALHSVGSWGGIAVLAASHHHALQSPQHQMWHPKQATCGIGKLHSPPCLTSASWWSQRQLPTGCAPLHFAASPASFAPLARTRR